MYSIWNLRPQYLEVSFLPREVIIALNFTQFNENCFPSASHTSNLQKTIVFLEIFLYSG